MTTDSLFLHLRETLDGMFHAIVSETSSKIQESQNATIRTLQASDSKTRCLEEFFESIEKQRNQLTDIQLKFSSTAEEIIHNLMEYIRELDAIDQEMRSLLSEMTSLSKSMTKMNDSSQAESPANIFTLLDINEVDELAATTMQQVKDDLEQVDREERQVRRRLLDSMY